jgi:hypothetical protein
MPTNWEPCPGNKKAVFIGIKIQGSRAGLQFCEIFQGLMCVISIEAGIGRRPKMKTETITNKISKGLVHCLICTHTVEADVVPSGRRLYVRAGQKCPRCSSSLDAGRAVVYSNAA